MNITQKTVAALALPAGKTDHIAFDDRLPGFGVRVRQGRGKTYVFQARLGGRQLRMTLGSVGAMKAEAARATAERYHAAVREGRNPQVEKRLAVAEQEHLFGALVDQYLAVKAKALKPRSLVEVTRHLQVHSKPLHKLPMKAIDKTLIADLIKKIANRRGPRIRDGVVTANRTRTSLSALFTWAMKETTYVESNPVINTHTAGAEKPRDRVLTNDELHVVWNALGADAYGDILRLLILTAQRLEEIAGLRWSEVDFGRGRFVLPRDRVKNGRAHAVPMSDTVTAILQARHAGRADAAELVFDFRSYTTARKALDERLADAGTVLAHWTPHDLRRTAATRMAEDVGVQPHVIEAILNHVSGHKSGVAGIYNLATYMPEKTQALNRWADHVAAIVEGRKTNVVALRTAS